MFFHATLRCICLFIPWGNSWGIFHCPSFWPSSHAAILTNQCLFMSHEENHLPLHVMGKCKGISHWSLYMSFHYLALLFTFFMFQTLILLEANDIWVHIWANENFAKPCLLEPWRWSHLGQQHKGPLYLYKLGLKLSRILSVSTMCQKEPKSCCSPLNSSLRSSSCNFAINK
jgi:hypothetical protein